MAVNYRFLIPRLSLSALIQIPNRSIMSLAERFPPGMPVVCGDGKYAGCWVRNARGCTPVLASKGCNPNCSGRADIVEPGGTESAG